MYTRLLFACWMVWCGRKVVQTQVWAGKLLVCVAICTRQVNCQLCCSGSEFQEHESLNTVSGALDCTFSKFRVPIHMVRRSIYGKVHDDLIHETIEGLVSLGLHECLGPWLRICDKWKGEKETKNFKKFATKIAYQCGWYCELGKLVIRRIICCELESIHVSHQLHLAATLCWVWPYIVYSLWLWSDVQWCWSESTPICRIPQMYG